MSSGDINMYNTLMDEMDKISTYLPGCITFIDDGFADVLHWLGGAEMLLSYGVEAIKKFSSFEVFLLINLEWSYKDSFEVFKYFQSLVYFYI